MKKQILSEQFRRMQKLAGIINENTSVEETILQEEKIPFFHLSQILKLADLSKPNSQQMADLKVGLNVLPKMAYRDENDVKDQLGKIIKIDGDTLTIKKVNGKEEIRKVSDVVHLIDGGYQF